jgi:hypothetical protein
MFTKLFACTSFICWEHAIAYVLIGGLAAVILVALIALGIVKAVRKAQGG